MRNLFTHLFSFSEKDQVKKDQVRQNGREGSLARFLWVRRSERTANSMSVCSEAEGGTMVYKSPANDTLITGLSRGNHALLHCFGVDKTSFRFLRYAAMVTLLLTLACGEMWAWATNVYLNGNFTGDNWNSSNSTYQFTLQYNSTSGKFYIPVYASGSTQYFRLWTNNHCGPATNDTEIDAGDDGEAASSYDEHNWKYIGDAGIISICIDQTGGKDWNPWVWVERPDIYIRHKWNNSSLSNQKMTDNRDGTYQYIGQFSSSSKTTYVGPCSNCSSDNVYFKKWTSPTLVGSPTNGDRCIFEYNASGYKGVGSSTSNTGSITITKLYSVTYDGNGKNSGSVPSSVTDRKWNVNTTIADNTGSLAKTGYVFAGWNTSADGTGTYYAPGSTFSPSAASTTLYAQWLTVHTPGLYETAAGSGGYGQSLVESDDLQYEVYQYAISSSKVYVYAGTSTTSTSAANYMLHYATSSGNAIRNWMLHSGGIYGNSSNSTHSKEFQQNAYQLNINDSYKHVIAVSGYDQFSIYAKDKTVSSAQVEIFVNGSKVTANSSTSQTIRRYNLTPETTYIIRIEAIGSGANASNDVGFSLRVPSVVCGATEPGDISKGSLSACSLPLTAAGSAASNNTWYWQSSSTGTDKTESGATKNVTATGTYYIRSYYSTGSCWSDAKSITVSASDLTPAAPTALTASSPTAKGVTLTVEDAANTNDYEFYVSTSSTAPTSGTTASYTVTSGKSKTITDKYAGTTFYAWARAKCGSNKSAWTALTGSTFTTSTVSASYSLTNVTQSSGATSGIGGSNYSAVFAGATDYALPSTITVTIGGNAATSGTDYTWNQGTGTLSITKEKITGNIAATISSAASAPSSVSIGGGYHYYPGETISLSLTVTGGNGPKTYQWYHGGTAEGNKIAGATSATFSKTCVVGDAGSYYCKVTCGGSASRTSSAFNVKVMQFYLKNSSGGDISNHALVKVDATHATLPLSLTGGTTYKFRVTDGCGNWFGSDGEMTSSNCTNWHMDQNNDCRITTSSKSATYTFNFDFSDGLLGSQMYVSVVYPSGNQASGKIIYWDNSVLNWPAGKQWYRIGKGTHNNKTQMTLVPGTANLYKVTTAEYNGFEYWHIANNEGQGTGNIFWTKDNSSSGLEITVAMGFEGSPVTADAVTITPQSANHAMGTSSDNNNCDFYEYDTQTGMKTDNVKITAAANGTITVNYTSHTGVASSFTNAPSVDMSQDLAHTVILTSITAVPDNGYTASAITINGGAYSANYVVTGATTIAASFSPATYTVTLNTNDGTINAGNVTSYTYLTGATLPTNVTKSGYRFMGWYAASDFSGDRVYSIGTSEYGNKEYWAKWAQLYAITDGEPSNGSLSITDGSSAITEAIAGETVYIEAEASSGYVFDAWNIYKTGTPATTVSPAAATASTSFTMPAYGVTVDASFVVQTYSLSYANGTGATGSASGGTAAGSYAEGTTITVPAQGTLAKTDYTFRGWTDGTTFYLAGQSFSMPASNVTLTAVWDGGTSCTEYELLASSASLATESSSAPKGHYITGIGKVMKSFDGSSSAGSISDVSTCHGSAKGIATGSGVIALQTYNAINKVTVYGIPGGNRTCDNIYAGTALGSYTSTDIKSSCDVNHNLGTKDVCGETSVVFPNTLAANSYIGIKLNGNINITGVLFENCVVSNFDVTFADGNTAPASHLTWPDNIAGVPSGKKILAPSTTPTASGYVFGGWYTDADCTSAVNWSTMTITADKTIYAKWTAKTQPTQYSVTGDSDFCSGGTATITLANSQSGISYQLLKGGAASGDPKAGTGSALEWEVNVAGTYTVKTIENATYSEREMSGSVTVTAAASATISTQPTASTDASVGSACSISGLVATGKNPTYQWYTCNSDGSSASAINAAGAMSFTGYTTATLGLTPSAVGTTYYKCVVSSDCGDPVTSNVVSVVAKNTISPTLSYPSSVIVGETISPTLTGNTGGGTVTYSLNSVSPAGSLTINSSTGVVTGVTAGGTATVTATIAAAGNYWGNTATSGTITVSKASISPSLSYASTSLYAGDVTATPTVTGNTGSGAVTYSVTSATPAGCVTVNSSTGVVTAVAAGTARVTASIAATTNYNSGSAYVDFTITNPCFRATITKSSSSYSVSGNSTKDITSDATLTSGGAVKCVNYNASSKNFNFSSDGVSPATSDGYVEFILPTGSILQTGSVIRIEGAADDAAGGLLLIDDAGTTVASQTNNGALDFTYTVTAVSTINGKNHLRLKRARTSGKNAVKRVTVTNCGEKTMYDITNADPAHGTIAITDGSSVITEAEEDETVHISATPADGYTFTSWSVTKDASGDPVSVATSSSTNPTTFTMPAEAVTVDATFTPNDYTITYHLNGASWASAAGVANYTYGVGATLPVAGDLSNVGYTFNGWYANSDLSTGGVKTSISTSDYGNKEFWAKWAEITYDVTYNANGGSGTTESQNGHYVTLRDNGFTAPSGKAFVEWNTADDGSGASYNEGEEVELTANLTLYAIWADDYTITWDASAKLSGVAATPNLGGGNYTITASVATWTGTLTADMISAATAGVTITNVDVDNSASPKTITATFNVGASVAGESITFELDVPADGVYGAKSSPKDIKIDRCTGSGSGSDGVLFSAEFKDSGLGTDNICDAANTPVTFTTDQLKAAPIGGSIKAYTTGNLGHMKYATNAISIAGTNGVIQIDLNSAIATNDLFTYVNVNGSSSSAYLRHTSADNTTDQIALTVYNSKEVKVRLMSGFNGKTTLYIVRNNSNFNLHKAAVVRPAFLMLLRDDTPTSTTDLSGTDVELTTSTYLSTISGGHVYFTSPASGNLKIYRSNSKNYIKFNNSAGYIKVVLNEALQEGDVIGFDSYNTNELAFTTTATRSTDIVTTNQLYTVNGTSALKGQTTFYIWNYSGSSDYLRGLQIARSGVAGGGGGSDQIATSLTWSGGLADGGLVTKDEGAADFTYSASTTSNTLGAITYTSSDAHVTVSSTGKVHIGSGIDFGGADYKDFTITANLAESGCYESASITYTLRVNNTCEDVAGTIGTEDLGCSGIRMTVTGQTTSGETVSYQWYKDGASIGGATSDTYTAIAAGEYYVIVTNTGDGHCSKASTNTVIVEAQASATATKIVDEWYVKNGRRTPDIALVQTENATGFIVKSGSTTIWNSDGSVTTGFAGCGFYLGEDGIIYLKGQQDDESEPAGLSAGDETLKFTASACGGNSSELSITIHKQAATSYKSVAFVVEGTKKGEWNAVTSGQADGSALYEYLDSVGTAASARKFALTECNIYKTNDEKTLRQYYSQFDAILITDNPNTKTVPSKGDDYKTKGYVNAIGSLIDIRPVLTMEAYVSALDNWKAKGINGNPSSPDPRQYGMKLDCKNHAIFKGINSSSSNVEVEDIDGVEYWTVIMVDSTKSPYSGVAYNAETKDKPALQGFEASDVSELLLLGEISDGALYAGVERQEEPAARLLLLGLNHQALPSALTPEGKKIIENALSYLIETDMERVDDCSNYFVGGTASKETDWNTASNWSKGLVPNSPYVKVRILSPCVVNSGTFKVASIDIATSGKSINKVGTINGSLTINAGAALVVGGRVRSAAAPYFNTGDLMPTAVADLVLNTSGSSQSALIFNNDKGDTKATVNLYSLGRKPGSYQYQYFAIPMEYLPVNPTFANETHGGTKIYTYVWEEGTSSWTRRKYYDDLYAFEGLGITTNSTESHMDYTMAGNLASTADREITLTCEGTGNNIIGNSYTAPISIASLVTAFKDDGNVTKTVYIYCAGRDADKGTGASGATETAGQWLAIPMEASGFDAWEGLKVIPAMQAFLIQVSGETSMILDYDAMVRSNTANYTEKLRAPQRFAEEQATTLTRLRVADSQTHTDLYLFEGNQFSEAFDNGWEAQYMEGDGRSAKLYAIASEDKMAVLATDELEGTIVGFAPGQETAYTFSFTGGTGEYYLNDLKLKQSTLISEVNSYLFTYEEGDENRFYISRTPLTSPQTPTGIDNTKVTPKAQKFIYHDKLYILRNGVLYDATGKVVK